MVGIATTALIDDMLTIEPAMLFAIIDRAACWVARNTPTTLISITFLKFSSVVSRKGSGIAISALLTKTDIGPCFVSIA